LPQPGAHHHNIQEKLLRVIRPSTEGTAYTIVTSTTTIPSFRSSRPPERAQPKL